MTEHVKVPVKMINGAKWGELSAFGASIKHVICGEKTGQDKDMALQGGHRVRQFWVKKNVHWLIPTGTALDIAGVQGAEPPRRKRG